MDALEALEAAAGAEEVQGGQAQGSGDGRRASAGTRAAPKSDVKTPATKRRRSAGILSEQFLSDMRAARSSSPGPASTDGAPTPKSVAESMGSGGASEAMVLRSEGDKKCLGCGRGAQTGKDWLQEGVKVSWAFNQARGQWCADCHTVWRTSFERHSLRFFADWLQIPENREEWQEAYVAHLSLLFEAMPKITAGMVRDRVRVVKFLQQLVGFTLSPTIVVPLAEHLAATRTADGAPPVVTPSHLVTLRTAEGDRLGVQVPASLQGLPTAVLRPAPALGCNLDRQAWMSTSVPADLEYLRGFGIAAGPVIAEAPEASPHLSKAAMKFASQKAACTNFLKGFAQRSWREIKESAVTPKVASMAQLNREATTLADDAVVMATQKRCHAGPVVRPILLHFILRPAENSHGLRACVCVGGCGPLFMLA